MHDQTTAKPDRPDGVNASVPWRVAEVRVLTDYTIAVPAAIPMDFADA